MSNSKHGLPEKSIVDVFRRMCEESLNPDLYSYLVDEILPILAQNRKQLCSTSELLSLAEMQAEDEGLWFEAKTAPEAYLQEKLKEIHKAINADTCLCTDDCPFKIFKDA